MNLRDHSITRTDRENLRDPKISPPATAQIAVETRKHPLPHWGVFVNPILSDYMFISVAFTSVALTLSDLKKYGIHIPQNIALPTINGTCPTIVSEITLDEK